MMAMDLGVRNICNKLPLKELALRRVATLLFCQPHMYMYASRMKYESKAEHEKAMDVLSKEILAEFSLPASLKDELASLMKPLFREVIKWMYFHEYSFSCTNTNLRLMDVVEHICWERYDRATVKYRETAESLIRHGILDVDKRYKLACLYCFEPYVRDLWNKLPVDSKIYLQHYMRRLKDGDSVLVVLWTCIIKGQENDALNFLRRLGNSHSSLCQYAFEYAALQGYRTATQYFCERLTSEEKELSLVKTASDVAGKRSFDYRTYLHEYQKFSDVLCYLFSQMTKEQVLGVLRSHPCETLKCFLDWPRQEVFPEIAPLAFPYLSEEDYSRLLFTLARNISSGYNYSKVFREFFVLSPRQLKNYTLTRYGHFLREFFKIGDVEAIRFIFRNMEAAEKAELAFSSGGMYIFFDLMSADKLRFLKMFIREFRLSKEDKKRFKVSFSERNAELLSQMGKWQWFVVLMNEVDADTSKCIGNGSNLTSED